MKRSRHTILAATLVVIACEGDGPAGPTTSGELTFQLDGQSYALSGSPASDPGQVLNASFAVARADSVGGVVLVGYQRTGENVGNLLVLQAPREAITFTCGGIIGGAPCHGRYITDVRSLNTSSAGRYFHVTSGSLTITQVGPTRLRGTFRVVLKADDNKPNDTLVVDNGTIDVPYVADQVTDGTLQCLLSLVGMGTGSCRS